MDFFSLQHLLIGVVSKLCLVLLIPGRFTGTYYLQTTPHIIEKEEEKSWKTNER
jgi:hypothetical protein